MTDRIISLIFVCMLLVCPFLTIGCGDSPEEPTPTAPEIDTPAETPSPVPSTPVAVTGDATSTTASGKVENITIVYDNTVIDDRLSADWGFAAVIELTDSMILFDSGGNGSMLLDNLHKLGIDPMDIDTVVLSHEHLDHVGGFSDLLALGIEPTIYLPESFSTSVKSTVSSYGTLVEVTEPMEIAPGVLVTGELGGGIVEQAVLLETANGTVVLTGCAHPGIVDILQYAKETRGEEIDLVVGGFHLNGLGQSQIGSIMDDFRRLGVRRVVPTHCTGELAISAFAEQFGDGYQEGGAGQVLLLDSE